MRILTLALIQLSTFFVFGQNDKVEYNQIVPEYVTAVWKNNGASNSSEFEANELTQIKEFFGELSKRQNNITSTKFLAKPTDNTLVAHYLFTKLKWNSFNGPHVGLKRESTKKVMKTSLNNLPNRNELLAFYYSSVFIDVLNKQKSMNLSNTNIDLDNLNLENDLEKAILFLTAMRHVGGQVTSYAKTRFPNNCFRAIEYVENMPTFNGRPFYEFQLPEFKDFKIEVDKRKPKMSFKKRYIPEFENAKSGIEKCMAEEKN
ncbi:hypothetical protein [Croceitalea vernalis]|uniref:DUF4919 domain-containing protein n=1 Tax=Croceitalea vernalis TaxID=3075599 RepID=A0ABU3BLA1_9FLAO|nr:hypothetical protein [Croceitalea sp. P007]MDT0622948.1 hypothetical protein [Croceitalea sp. P007]